MCGAAVHGLIQTIPRMIQGSPYKTQAYREAA